MAFKPWTVFGVPPTDWPTGHGTPYAYDRRVPMIFWGPWKAGERPEPVRTVDLAPTLARELGLKPGPVDGKALDLGSREKGYAHHQGTKDTKTPRERPTPVASSLVSLVSWW